MCVFCSIINGEIPSKRVYEDDNMIIINDLNPQANKHYLMIPKEHFPSILEMTKEQADKMRDCFLTLAKLVPTLGLDGGFRLISNKGKDGRQSVDHLHVHIVGGELLSDKMC